MMTSAGVSMFLWFQAAGREHGGVTENNFCSFVSDLNLVNFFLWTCTAYSDGTPVIFSELEKHRRPNISFQSRKHFEHKYANHLARFRGHAITWPKCSRKIRQFCANTDRKDVDAETKHREQCCQSRFGNICEPIWGRKETNAWIICWRSSETLDTLQPLMTTQSDIKQNWAALIHPRRTSQLHCLQYFLPTRIECPLLGLVQIWTSLFTC